MGDDSVALAAALAFHYSDQLWIDTKTSRLGDRQRHSVGTLDSLWWHRHCEGAASGLSISSGPRRAGYVPFLVATTHLFGVTFLTSYQQYRDNHPVDANPGRGGNRE